MALAPAIPGLEDPVFLTHFRRTLITFATTLGYYRAIFQRVAQAQIATQFWHTTANSHYDISIIEWCKVLGTDAEPLHWKRAFAQATHGAVRADIQAAVGMPVAQWREYHAALLNYRNNIGAHFDPGVRVPKYPVMASAQAAAGAVYARLEQLYPVGGPDLDTVCQRAERRAHEAVNLYLKGRDAG